MNRLLVVIVALLIGLPLVAGCDDVQIEIPTGPAGVQQQPQENPCCGQAVLDVPEAWRVANYHGGSCVHAAIATLMKWQGLHDHAAWWTANYDGGEVADRLNRRLNAARLRYAVELQGDEAFLRRCVDLRLGVAVNWPPPRGTSPGHMVTLVGIDDDTVYIVDNNDTQTVAAVPLDHFLDEWTGWAVTLVYVPPPPTPYL